MIFSVFNVCGYRNRGHYKDEDKLTAKDIVLESALSLAYYVCEQEHYM